MYPSYQSLTGRQPLGHPSSLTIFRLLEPSANHSLKRNHSTNLDALPQEQLLSRRRTSLLPYSSMSSSLTETSSNLSPSSPATTTSPPAIDPQQTAEARNAFLTHLSSTATSHLNPLQSRAADIQANSTALNTQTQSVQSGTRDLEKESQKYEKVLGEAGKGLKEIGDVQNWAEMLERDLGMLEEMMETVEGEEGMRREDVNGGGGKGKRGGGGGWG